MKQVFECGITGTSNDEVGDSFLANLAGIRFPPTHERKLPDDFSIEIHDHDWMLELRGKDKYVRLFAAMIERGYEVIRWRDEEGFCEVVRFRRA